MHNWLPEKRQGRYSRPIIWPVYINCYYQTRRIRPPLWIFIKITKQILNIRFSYKFVRINLTMISLFRVNMFHEINIRCWTFSFPAFQIWASNFSKFIVSLRYHPVLVVLIVINHVMLIKLLYQDKFKNL